jgi:hypothetical protein
MVLMYRSRAGLRLDLNFEGPRSTSNRASTAPEPPDCWFS